jgi:hypothetical protein
VAEHALPQEEPEFARNRHSIATTHAGFIGLGRRRFAPDEEPSRRLYCQHGVNGADEGLESGAHKFRTNARQLIEQRVVDFAS